MLKPWSLFFFLSISLFKMTNSSLFSLGWLLNVLEFQLHAFPRPFEVAVCWHGSHWICQSKFKIQNLLKSKDIYRYTYLGPETAKQQWSHPHWECGQSETRNTVNYGSCKALGDYFGHSMFQLCRHWQCPHHEFEGSQSCSWCCSPDRRKERWYEESDEEKNRIQVQLSISYMWDLVPVLVLTNGIIMLLPDC